MTTEETVKNNPLKNYFRRPALYLKLPSQGIGYPKGSINLPENGELPIYPMTAIDEITARTPDALFNGVAVTEIIKSCVPNIIEPWKVLQVDLDPILMAIKIASNGGEMDIETTCPECKEEGKYGINLSGLLAEYKPGDYATPLVINDLKIKFKPIDYKKVHEGNDLQFEIQRSLAVIQSMSDSDERNAKSTEIIERMNSVTMDLVTDTIEFIKTPEDTVFEREFIKEFFTHCDLKTYTTIREHSVELRKSSETKPLHFKCASCEHEYDQPFNINVSDFFE